MLILTCGPEPVYNVRSQKFTDIQLLHQEPNSGHRFYNIHIDIVGLLPPSTGYSYLLTYIDHFTCWPEAFPLTNITAESILQTFVNGWISRFGIPSMITTDHEKQFVSTLWDHLTQLPGCKQIRKTAYHQ